MVEVDKLEGHLAGLEEIWPLYEGLEGWSKVVADWLRNPQPPTREGFPDLLVPHLWVAAACESGRYPPKRSPERGTSGGVVRLVRPQKEVAGFGRFSIFGQACFCRR